MFKQTFLPFAAVMVYLVTSNVCANMLSMEEAMPREIKECLAEYNIVKETFFDVIKAGKFDHFDPCFFGCVFKKFGIVNSKGMYDVDKASEFIHSRTHNEDTLTKLEDIKEECTSVNDEKFSGEDESCERSILVLMCFNKRMHEMGITKEQE